MVITLVAGFVGAFFAAGFFADAFLTGAFLAEALLTGARLAEALFAGALFADAFFAIGFLLAAFFVGAFERRLLAAEALPAAGRVDFFFFDAFAADFDREVFEDFLVLFAIQTPFEQRF